MIRTWISSIRSRPPRDGQAGSSNSCGRSNPSFAAAVASSKRRYHGGTESCRFPSAADGLTARGLVDRRGVLHPVESHLALVLALLDEGTNRLLDLPTLLGPDVRLPSIGEIDELVDPYRCRRLCPCRRFPLRERPPDYSASEAARP